jgi:hypothetical protein
MPKLKIAGFLLMLAGWAIAVTAILLLLHTSVAKMVFVLAGVGIEVLGFVLVARAHVPRRRTGDA